MALQFLTCLVCVLIVQTTSAGAKLTDTTNSTEREQINSALKTLGQILTAVDNVALSINETLSKNKTASKDAIVNFGVELTTNIFDQVVGGLNSILTNISTSQDVSYSVQVIAMCFTVQRDDFRSFTVKTTKNWTGCMLDAEETSLFDNLQDLIGHLNTVTKAIISAQEELEACKLGDDLCLLELTSHLDAIVGDINEMVKSISGILKALETLFKADVVTCNSYLKLQAFDYLNSFVTNFVWCVGTLRN